MADLIIETNGQYDKIITNFNNSELGDLFLNGNSFLVIINENDIREIIRDHYDPLEILNLLPEKIQNICRYASAVLIKIGIDFQIIVWGEHHQNSIEEAKYKLRQARKEAFSYSQKEDELRAQLDSVLNKQYGEGYMQALIMDNMKLESSLKMFRAINSEFKNINAFLGDAVNKMNAFILEHEKEMYHTNFIYDLKKMYEIFNKRNEELNIVLDKLSEIK